MKEKTVIVEIDEEGNSSLDLNGFDGQGCSSVAKDFQSSDVLKFARAKPEFYVHKTTGKRQGQQS